MKKKLQQFLIKKPIYIYQDRFFRYRNLLLIRTLVSVFCIFLTALPSCSKRNLQKKPEDIRFALIGNTYSENPYSGTGLKIGPLFLKLNEENPVFVIHTGDIICGGERWSGIIEKDMEKQLSNFLSFAGNLKSILYTTMGELDLLNGSADVYSKFTGRKEYYSFNYGNIHLLVLNTTDARPGTIGNKQMEWMLQDLDNYKNSHSIFIFSHHPLFIPRWCKAKEDEILLNSEKLHKIFLKYPVRAVFSGHLQVFSKQDIDGILYVIAGCGDYDKKYYTKNYQYYIVDYSEGTVNIQAKRF